MRIIFSGGGTGGHIYPALAIREILMKKYDFESGYVGVIGGMEEKIVSRINDIQFMGVRAQGMPRTLSPKLLSFPFINLMGVIDAFKHLKKFKPELVIATGGFVPRSCRHCRTATTNSTQSAMLEASLGFSPILSSLSRMWL